MTEAVEPRLTDGGAAAGEQPPQDATKPPVTRRRRKGIVDELARLATLQREGAITGEEYEAAKARLLHA